MGRITATGLPNAWIVAERLELASCSAASRNRGLPTAVEGEIARARVLFVLVGLRKAARGAAAGAEAPFLSRLRIKLPAQARAYALGSSGYSIRYSVDQSVGGAPRRLVWPIL